MGCTAEVPVAYSNEPDLRAAAAHPIAQPPLSADQLNTAMQA
jgi:hypothetical protein